MALTPSGEPMGWVQLGDYRLSAAPDREISFWWAGYEPLHPQCTLTRNPSPSTALNEQRDLDCRSFSRLLSLLLVGFISFLFVVETIKKENNSFLTLLYPLSVLNIEYISYLNHPSTPR